MRILIQPTRWLPAALAALLAASTAQAQYAPYGPAAAPQQYNPAAAQYGQAPTNPAYAQIPGYAAAPGYGQPAQNYPQVAQGYAPAQVAQGYAGAQVAAPAVAPTTPPATNYGVQQQVPYVATAYQPQAVAQVDDSLTLPPAESVAPGTAQAVAPTPMPESYPAPSYQQPMPGYQQPMGGQPMAGQPVGGAPGCNCQGSLGQAMASYDGYGACDTSGYGYGSCNNGNCGYSTFGSKLRGAGCGYWFGGVYGLLMERDNANKYPLVFAQNNLNPGDYPDPGSTVLTTRNVDTGFQGGVEFRFGRTFGCAPLGGCGGSDTCGYGGCGCAPRWGLEVGYWQLFEANEYVTYTDQVNTRTYGAMPMRGLSYNSRPVNDYTDYAPPVINNDIEVRTVRVNSDFQVQNLELNLLRLSICGGGLGYGGGYSVCGGPSACGGCDSCSTGGCAGGACGGCSTCGLGPRYSCTGVCGLRYMQFDEGFRFGVDFYNNTTATDGFINYYSRVRNNLLGFQLGCNGIYRIGCRWGLNVATNVGVYGDDIDVRQYFTVPNGNVYYTGMPSENFDVNANKTDVSMIGELRLGASYQATCHCRLYGGWRAIGVTGLALATNQFPNTAFNSTQLASYVNSNGSMILHGLQTGVEWNY